MSKNKKITKWSIEEDNIVREAVQKANKEGATLKSAFEQAATLIDRTVSSINFRWNNKLKKLQLVEQPTKKAVPTEIDISSDSTQYLDTINYIQKLKKQQDTYTDLKVAYDKLLIEFDTLTAKFENISKIIS